jgi:hypothetical protein
MTDVEVLAEVAHEIAAGKKDRPRTVLPHKGAFFSKMGTIARYDSLSSGLADTLFIRQTIHAAPPWTELAVFKDFFRLTDLFL